MSRQRFHGDPGRFDVVAQFIADRFPDARYVADVAGGQGMLTRILRKRFGFEAEVIDPRGWTLKRVHARTQSFDAAMADDYDVIVGLHPDEGLRSVVESAERSAVMVVPCFNFWSRDTNLGRDQLMEHIFEFHGSRGGSSERVILDFADPKNHALVLLPPTRPPTPDVEANILAAQVEVEAPNFEIQREARRGMLAGPRRGAGRLVRAGPARRARRVQGGCGVHEPADQSLCLAAVAPAHR